MIIANFVSAEMILVNYLYAYKMNSNNLLNSFSLLV